MTQVTSMKAILDYLDDFDVCQPEIRMEANSIIHEIEAMLTDTENLMAIAKKNEDGQRFLLFNIRRYKAPLDNTILNRVVRTYHKAGWKHVYVQNAEDYTTGGSNMKDIRIYLGECDMPHELRQVM